MLMDRFVYIWDHRYYGYRKHLSDFNLDILLTEFELL